MCLQQFREERLHLALVVAASLLQLQRDLLQLHLYVHLVLKLPLFIRTHREREETEEETKIFYTEMETFCFWF